MNHQAVTEQYYSCWLGTELSSLRPWELRCVYSEERNHAQYGYGKPFDLLLFLWADRAALSYGTKAAAGVRRLTEALRGDPGRERISDLIFQIYKKQPERGVKYLYGGAGKASGSQARVLQQADFPLLLDFYQKRAARPQACSWEWLEPYFNQHAGDGFFCAVFQDGQIASCTDAPGMPYMPDSVQEVGIYTLPAYRGNGYAAQACAAAVRSIRSSGRCPQWSTTQDNLASQKLAVRAGFLPWADTWALTL